MLSVVHSNRYESLARSLGQLLGANKVSPLQSEFDQKGAEGWAFKGTIPGKGDAFFVVLKPIARILLRYGIGFREFAEVAKSAFVDVATAEYGIRGRPTNISRVAVMTGLTRKEVRRLRDQLQDADQAYTIRTEATGCAPTLFKAVRMAPRPGSRHR